MKNILIAMPFDDTHKAYIEKIGTDCEFRYTTIKTATAEEVSSGHHFWQHQSGACEAE